MVLDLAKVCKGLTNEEIRGCVIMATNTSYFNRRLDSTLGEYAELGFHFKKAGYNIVDLYFKDKKLATYNNIDVTPIDIVRQGCRNYLNNLTRGD